MAQKLENINEENSTLRHETSGVNQEIEEIKLQRVEGSRFKNNFNSEYIV